MKRTRCFDRELHSRADIDLTGVGAHRDLKEPLTPICLPLKFSSVVLSDTDGKCYFLEGQRDELVQAIRYAGYKLTGEIERRTWEEFAAAGLFWWINRALHVFGWSLVYAVNEAGRIVDVYPAKTPYRGFSEEDEVDGFRKVTNHMQQNAADLQFDLYSPEQVYDLSKKSPGT